MDILINDYKIRCHNLQNKLTPYKVNTRALERRAKKIQRKDKCDDLTAWRTLKKQLESEVAEKKSVSNASLC